MNYNFEYLDIVLLALFAGFIILRLREILGRRTGHESKPYQNFEQKDFKENTDLSRPLSKLSESSSISELFDTISNFSY